MPIEVHLDNISPISVRVNQLEPGQAGIQIDRDNIWMKVNDRLMFAPRNGSSPWMLAPRDNVKVFVNPFPPGTELTFKTAA